MAGKKHRELRGPKLRGFRVVSLYPGQHPDGAPTAVAIVLEVEGHGDLVLRLRSPAAVDRLVAALRVHRRDVWPDAPAPPNP